MEMVDDATKELLFDSAVLSGGVSEETAAHLLAIDAPVARRALRQLAWLHLVGRRCRYDLSALPQPRPIRDGAARRSAAQREASMRRAASAMQEAVDALRPHRAEPLLTSQLDVLADEHENLRQVIGNRLEVDPESRCWSCRSAQPSSGRCAVGP